jgi:DEAD/DEAH box helicase domain-containing protein
VRLPDMQMHTTSFWLTLPDLLFADLGRATAMDALHGIAHALETVATIALMCEPRDLGQAIGDKSPQPTEVVPKLITAKSAAARFDPTLFLYDSVPGGVGLAERIYELIDTLLARTHQMIVGCSCPAGCPACVGPSETPGRRKAAAAELLQAMGVDGSDQRRLVPDCSTEARLG